FRGRYPWFPATTPSANGVESPSIEDVWAAEVLERDAPGVDQAREWERGPERPGDDRVQLVEERRPRCRADVWIEVEGRAPPSADRVAVVVWSVRREVVPERHQAAHDDQGRQQEVGEDVEPGG